MPLISQLAMAYQLTNGAIARMMRKEDIKNPTLQAIHVKQVSKLEMRFLPLPPPLPISSLWTFCGHFILFPTPL